MPYSTDPNDLTALLDQVLDDPGLVKALEETRLPPDNLRIRLKEVAPDALGPVQHEIEEFNQRETELKDIEADVVSAAKPPGWARGLGCLSIIGVIAALVWGSALSMKPFGIPARYFLAVLGTAAGAAFFALFVRQFHKAEESSEQKAAKANLAARREFVKKERDRLDTLLKERLLTEAGTILARLIKPSWALILDYIPLGVLDQVWSVGTYVPTGALKEIDGWLDYARGASLGVAGPRGAGKSTLLQHLCDRKRKGKEDIQLLTSAPVEYDTRDFILHLLAGLSRRILQMKEKDTSRDFAWENVEHERQASISAFFLYSGLIGVLLLIVGTIAIVVGVLALPASQPAANGNTGAPALRWSFLWFGFGAFVLGLAAVGASTIARLDAMLQKNISLEELPPAFRPIVRVFGNIMGRLTRTSLARVFRRPSPGSSLALARKTLGDVLFQRTYSGGWSGGLKIPVGIEAGTTSGISMAVVPQSLPELVYRFQNFVRKVTGEGGSVIVAIDELDKMPSDEAAQKFLNGIKIVFNIPGCYFLVSVSESALSSFERRGLPVRDVFDSSFDDVIRVRYLGPEDSQKLLGRRLLAMPEPFHWLYHCLSGGLSRDLVRVGKEMLPFKGKTMICGRAFDSPRRDGEAGCYAAGSTEKPAGCRRHRTAGRDCHGFRSHPAGIPR